MSKESVAETEADNTFEWHQDSNQELQPSKASTPPLRHYIKPMKYKILILREQERERETDRQTEQKEVVIENSLKQFQTKITEYNWPFE